MSQVEDLYDDKKEKNCKDVKDSRDRVLERDLWW